ncbi:MAG: discoidin domain-containing protein, partial [bacterium]
MRKCGKLRNSAIGMVHILCLFAMCGSLYPVEAGQGDVPHQVHLTAARGPGIVNDCSVCHIPTQPTEQKHEVNYSACIPCHSPAGIYDGLEDPNIGAKYNWGDGAFSLIYDPNGNIKTGKEKWCLGCHDDGTCVMQGVTAPNIAGSTMTGYWESPASIVESDTAIPEAANLIDGNLETGTVGGQVVFDLGGPLDISHIRLYVSSGTDVKWEVYGGNDLVTWTRMVFGRAIIFSLPTWQTGPQEGWHEIRLDKFFPVQYIKLVKISPWPLGNAALREFQVKRDLRYGYSITGHKIGCDSCHNTDAIHIDSIAQTYRADLNNYQAGYRLNDVEVEGQIVPPLEVPRVGCNWGELPRTSNDFALCFACHNKSKLLGDAYGSAEFFVYPLHTNFRNDNSPDLNGFVKNAHLLHLRGRFYCGNGLDWDSDWEGPR